MNYYNFQLPITSFRDLIEIQFTFAGRRVISVVADQTSQTSVEIQ